MRYFPVFLDSQALNALVVGAGEVAARKVELLLKSEANIAVVAPWACDLIEQLAAEGKIDWQQRPYQASDIEHQQLVFVATDDPELNATISHQCKAQGIMVNVVDNTPLCGFITPSIIDRSPITIAMVSGGVAPVLLRYLRQKLEAWIPQKVARLGAFAERHREKVKAALDSVTKRRYFWEDALDGDIAEQVYSGNEAKAERQLERLLATHQGQPQQGQVYLVGAGPGDPELLTFKALRLMQKADVVVYDRLVSPAILELVRRDAEKVYVGKAQSNHTLPQEDINALMVERAKQGERVVRLKGGDPYIFGRGGEEIQTLVEHGIDFQVVPGITAASGAASYGGIPLTHRDHAQSVVFATGHLRDDSISLDWPALVQKNQTLVFYMGVTGLGVICRELINHGMREDMPIALVESATTEQQRVVTGTLKTIENIAAEAQIKPPALIIVGTVVTLQSQLGWYQPKPG